MYTRDRHRWGIIVSHRNSLHSGWRFPGFLPLEGKEKGGEIFPITIEGGKRGKGGRGGGVVGTALPTPRLYYIYIWFKIKKTKKELKTMIIYQIIIT